MLTGFIRYFFRVLCHIKAVIVMLVTLKVAGADALTLFEKMPFGDTLYFAFVTGLTIGCGDIVVKIPHGRSGPGSCLCAPVAQRSGPLVTGVLTLGTSNSFIVLIDYRRETEEMMSLN
jgi:hypothetical protein